MRPVVKYEASCKRRVNVLGALRYGASANRLVWESRTSHWDSQGFLEFIWHKIIGLSTSLGELPPGWKLSKHKVVVLDNYRVPQSQLVKEHLGLLKQAGVVFYYLPPYSPELNLIEVEWRQIKYQGLPQRSFEELAELLAAVETALKQRAA